MAKPGQSLGKAWAKPGQSLGKAWAKPGQSLGQSLGGAGQAWAKPGQSLGKAWAKPGPGLARASQRLGCIHNFWPPPLHWIWIHPKTKHKPATCWRPLLTPPCVWSDGYSRSFRDATGPCIAAFRQVRKWRVSPHSAYVCMCTCACTCVHEEFRCKNRQIQIGHCL